MYSLPKIEDKIEALHQYIQSNLSESESSLWFYILNPAMVSHLKEFSKEECENLVLKIWDWDDEILRLLADPLKDDYYSHLDGGFLYCKIFLFIKDPIYLECLRPDLSYAVSRINAGTQPLSFYLDLENKVMETFKFENSYSIECIRDKFEKERNLLQEKP